MKPDWKDAPSWARWVALSTNGEWTWFEEKPWRDVDGDYMPGAKGKWEFAGTQDVLEERP